MGVDHYENFPVASFLLPRRLREPVACIYRFARSADDIADEGNASDTVRLERLEQYRHQLLAAAAGLELETEPANAVFRSLGEVIRRHRLPSGLFVDLLDAFSQDVVKKSYVDYAELLDYCRRSANPVGRLLLTLLEISDERSLGQSDAICTSLQLINFWQDVAIDRAKGRVYFPQDSLARFGYLPDDHGPSTCDYRFRALMRFEVERARALMLTGAPLAGRLGGRFGLELSHIVQGGLRILERIESIEFDVFVRRPVLSWTDWLVIIWRASSGKMRAPVQ